MPKKGAQAGAAYSVTRLNIQLQIVCMCWRARARHPLHLLNMGIFGMCASIFVGFQVARTY